MRQFFQMDNIQPFISLPSNRLEKFTSEFLWGSLETIYFASEVTKMHLKGGQDSRIVIITIGSIYVFRSRSFTKGELANQYNLVDVEKVTYIEPNIVTFLIRNNEGQGSPLTLQSENALDIARCILYLNQICKYFCPEMGQAKVDSTPPQALVLPKITSRPKNALQIRIVQLAHKNNQKFPLENLKLISEWDEKPQNKLKLSSQFSGFGPASLAIAQAIAMDPDAKNLLLDNFAHEKILSIIQAIFERSKSLIRLSLDNYIDSPAEELVIKAPISRKLIDISFKNVHPKIMFPILNSLEKFSGRITMLSILRTRLPSDHFRILFDLINRFPCFIGLINLRFEEGSAVNLVLDDLSRFIPLIKVQTLAILNASKDISALCKSVFPRTQSIKKMNFSSNQLLEMTNPDLSLPDVISYLDISHSKVNAKSLSSFLNAIFTKPREPLFTINLADLENVGPANEPIVNSFNIEGVQPILVEINFSGNTLLPEQTKVFLNFLRTQKKLRHLNLSRCFKEQIDESLKLLVDFIFETKLEELELSSSPNCPLQSHMTNFIKLLSKKKAQLSTLIISRSGMGDEGLLALKELVDNDRNCRLTSLDCDGAFPQTASVFSKCYQSFVKVDRLSFPRFDIERLNQQNQRNYTLPNNMQSKLPPANLFMRLTDYEKNVQIAGSFSTFSPMSSLIDLMGKMTTIITGKKQNIDVAQNQDLSDASGTGSEDEDIDGNAFENDDLISIFKQSLPTSTVHLKAEQESRKASPLMKYLNSEKDHDSNNQLGSLT